MATDATPAVLWETRRTATGLLPSAPERLRRGGREEPSQELLERKAPSQQLCSNKRQRKQRGRRAGAENIPLSHRHIVLAAGKGPGASATAPEAAPRRRAPAACPPAARQPAPSRGRANLLWFSKGCAGQFERLPFSREALRRVVLRNPHLRLICRTKTSSRHSSCRSGAGSPVRHVLLAGAGDSDPTRRLAGKDAAPRWSCSAAPLEPRGTPLPSRGGAGSGSSASTGSYEAVRRHRATAHADVWGFTRDAREKHWKKSQPPLLSSKQQKVLLCPNEALLNPKINTEN